MDLSWKHIALAGLVVGGLVESFTQNGTFLFSVALTLAIGFGYVIKYLVEGGHLEGGD